MVTMGSTEREDIPLAELIETLRLELEKAQALGREREIGFSIDKVELELKVAVTKKAKGAAGVKFWVVNARGELESSDVVTHTFKLSFSPVLSRSGGKVMVAAEAKLVRPGPDARP